MRIRSWVLALLAVMPVIVFNSCSTANNGTTSGTGFMWVATKGDQLVSSFTIDLSNGAVSSVRSSVSTGPQPTAAALTPDGKTLFVSNLGDSTIAVYTVNQSDGTLTVPCASSQPKCAIVTFPAGATPVAMTIDPSGSLLFVANQGNSGALGQPGTVPGTISVFSIANLSQPPLIFPTALSGDVTGNGPTGLAIPISGSYLYVADQFSSVVAVYSYDSSGNLTLINSYPVAANPSALAFSRTVANSNRDNFLFVSNTGANQVSVFSACVAVTLNCGAPTGVLSQISAPFSAPTGPGPILVDPAFDWAYVIEQTSFQVSEFAFAPATGALSALSPATISTGVGPVSGGITSDGNWAFIANSGQSNLSAFAVGATGKLSPANTSTVILANQPSAIVVR